MAEEVQTGFVIDNGTEFTRAGFSGDPMPRAVLPTVVGQRRHNIIIGSEDKQHYVGDDAESHRGILNLSYPMHRGLINNFDDMQRIWHNIFYEQLKLNVFDAPTIMTESPLAPAAQREKTTEVMFEYFSSPAFFMKDTASFAIFSSGHDSGVLVESGAGTTTVVPFYKNNIIKSAIVSMDIGGEDLTARLVKSLANKNIDLTSNVGQALAGAYKQKHCFVALDPTSQQPQTVSVELPTGETVQITDELHTVPEVLFQPPLLGVECDGVHQLICSAIKKTDPAIQSKLWKTIILSGGNTLFNGFEQRLQKELTPLAPPERQIRVIAEPNRKYLPYSGASMIASLESFQQFWVTKEEYDENGPGIMATRQESVDNEFSTA